MKNKHKNNTNQKGFTLVEIILALTITAFLLVTIAAAFNASSQNYSENKQYCRQINNMRQAISRMTRQIRTAQAIDPDAPLNQCSMITSDNEDITYLYNSDTRKLFLRTNDSTTDPDFLLCEDVHSLTFTKTTETVDGVTEVKSVQIEMVAEENGKKYYLSASSVPRRTLWPL